MRLRGWTVFFAEMSEEVVPTRVRRRLVEEVINDRVRVHSKFCFHHGEFVLRSRDTRSCKCGLDSPNPCLDVRLVEGG